MVKYQSDLDTTFAALADPTRRAILARLALGETRVTDLAEPFRISLPAISRHLKVLEGAGLLRREKDGRVHRCRLEAGPMKTAVQWIEKYRSFWESQFDALERYLEQTTGKERREWQQPAARPPRSRSRGPSRRSGKKSSKRGRTRKS